MRHVAVIDIGKTNAKLALVAADDLREVAVLTRPNAPLPGPPFRHFDLGGHWDFILHGLGRLHAAHGIDAVSVTTHGAAAVCLDARGEALPMLDYEDPGPGTTAAAYDALRPGFAETGSPRLPMGLNLGAQLHWLSVAHPDLWARTARVLTYPQYWGWRLTGEAATEVTSLGCHTDLWTPFAGGFSALVDRLGLRARLPAPRRPGEVLGHLRPDAAAATGLPRATPVAVGIHDSNASLLPHLLARQGAFAVASTGTWVVAMAVGGQAVALDPARDTLVNVDALGQPVRSARFMGGREHDLVLGGSDAAVTAADRAGVAARGVMLLPSVEPASGPFPGRRHRWTADPRTDGERRLALARYLALMTATCLDLAGAAGPVVVEGPFARNADLLDMLAAVRPGGVEAAISATGTSVGAALLCLPAAPPPATRAHPVPPEAEALRALSRDWRAAAG